MSYPNARDCVHGSLRRSCRVCELEAEVMELRSLLAAVIAERDDLCELMGIDPDGEWWTPAYGGRPVEDTPPL